MTTCRSADWYASASSRRVTFRTGYLPVYGAGAGSSTVMRIPCGCARGEGECAVVCLGDGLDDGQAEADACVVGAHALGAALEWFRERRGQLWGERRAGVFDREHHSPGADAGVDPHSALFRQVVDDRVVHEIRRELQQERRRSDRGGDVAVGLDGDAVLFREREKRLGGFFRHEGQVDRFSGEGPLVGAAEQEQRFSEIDGSGVDDVEAVDEFGGAVVRVDAGHVEKCLRDRQRGAQLVRGVGGESLRFGDVCFEPGEHRVEGVGEFAELVVAARQSDPVGE